MVWNKTAVETRAVGKSQSNCRKKGNVPLFEIYFLDKSILEENTLFWDENNQLREGIVVDLLEIIRIFIIIVCSL